MAIAMLSPTPEGASERGKKGGRGEKAPTSGEVLSQRVTNARAVLECFIKLTKVELKSDVPNHVRIAPSFINSVLGKGDGPLRGNDSNKTPLYYTNQTLAEFLGWVAPNGDAQDRVTDSVAALAFIEQEPSRAWEMGN